MQNRKIKLFLGLMLVSLAASSIADSSVGVIHWNVKAYLGKTNGGWNVPANRTEMINAIKDKIANNQVDFISLVQTNEAYAADKKTPISNITKLDQALNPAKWGGFYNSCWFDGNQLIYDKTKWKPMPSTAVGGGFKGCGEGLDNRPYEMALFQNISSPKDRLVLFISVHFPHGPANKTAWDQLGNFEAQVNEIINHNGGPGEIRVIMTGDMNEVGASFYGTGYGQEFINLFKGSDSEMKTGLSGNVSTCCNATYNDNFDKVYATNSIINAPSPAFNIKEEYLILEQHRGIYALVEPLDEKKQCKLPSDSATSRDE